MSMNPVRTMIGIVALLWPLWLILAIASLVAGGIWGWRGAIGAPLGLFVCLALYLGCRAAGGWLDGWWRR